MTFGETWGKSSPTRYVLMTYPSTSRKPSNALLTEPLHLWNLSDQASFFYLDVALSLAVAERQLCYCYQPALKAENENRGDALSIKCLITSRTTTGREGLI